MHHKVVEGQRYFDRAKILNVRTFMCMTISCQILLRIRNVSDNFFRKSCRLSDNEQKYGRAMCATDVDTAHALCMLDN